MCFLLFVHFLLVPSFQVLLPEVIHIKILENALFFPAVMYKDWRQNKLCGRTQEGAMSSAYQLGVCAAETY